jgi:two-component system OmpR family response regulator
MPAEAPEYSTKATAAQTVRSLALLECLDACPFEHDNGPVPSRAPNARVLIVDDDVSVTELFARMLRLEGFEVWAAHSADEGLSLAQTHRPHAVILDLRMPLTSGVQVLRSLRAIQGMQHTPVTIVTGDYYLAESQTNEIHALGADVRFKPLWLDELVTLARDMLHTPVRD